jgi:hypothetical protein
MSTEYWIITYHPPGAPQIPVGVLAIHSGSDSADVYMRSQLDQVATGDDLLVLRGLPVMFADEAASVGARRALERWTDTLSHAVRIDGPFESNEPSAGAIWAQSVERLDY